MIQNLLANRYHRQVNAFENLAHGFSLGRLVVRFGLPAYRPDNASFVSASRCRTRRSINVNIRSPM